MAVDETLRIEPSGDIALLSRLFLELAEDERSDVHRTQQQAYDDIVLLLSSGKKAFVFMSSLNVAGYALVDTNRKTPYLHHFYICRSERRKGYGTVAFNLLLEALNTRDIDLDVFVWNERGKAFWESLGFKPRAMIMRYQS